MPFIIVTYLRRERRNWGLTQRDLAFLVGLKSRTQISALENGAVRPSVEQALIFQLLFGMTAAQLFPGVVRESEEHALRRIRAMIERTQADSTVRADRKSVLLRQSLLRAVMS
jgi:transcriptional regulator with XRE-family HTH domain